MNRQAKPISRCSSWNRSSTLACTDTSSAEVGSSAISRRGLERQRPGDADPLPLAAGQLVRVAVAQVAGQVHPVQQVLDPLAQRGTLGLALQQQRLADRLADRQPRVERRAGVLEHEADVRAAPCAGPPWRCRPCRCRARDAVPSTNGSSPTMRPADRRLARAGLADQARRPRRGRPCRSTSSTARNAGARPRLGYSMATSRRSTTELDARRAALGTGAVGSVATDSSGAIARRPASSRSTTIAPRCGTASQQLAACTGRSGAWKTSSAVPASTIRPSCITSTRSAMSATTPMSWVISRMPASMRSRRSRISLRISACTVTSSAVVGSSAISSSGSQRQRLGDHRPLPLAAGQLVRVGVDAPLRARGSRPASSSSMARCRAAFGAIAWWLRSISAIWNPMVYTGFSAVIGSWKMTETSLPRIDRSDRGSMPTSSPAVELDRAPDVAFFGSRPSSDIAVVDLPDPDSPTMASTSPALSSNDGVDRPPGTRCRRPRSRCRRSRDREHRCGAGRWCGSTESTVSLRGGALTRWRRASRVPAVVRSCAERRHRRRVRGRRWSRCCSSIRPTALRGRAVAGAGRRGVLGGVLAAAGRGRRRRRAPRQRVPHDRPAVAVDPGGRHQVGADADHGVRQVQRLGRTGPGRARRRRRRQAGGRHLPASTRRPTARPPRRPAVERRRRRRRC